MAMKNMRQGMPNLFKQGTKHIEGVNDAVVRNIEACKQLATKTRSSYGPNGMNKMVINHLDRLFVTSDAATIMNEMEVVHPAAKMMVMASNQQDNEIGDGSNFVLVFCGELLNKAEGLLRMGLHPADIVRGYQLAQQHAMDVLQEISVHTEDDLFNQESLGKACKSALAAKQYGCEDFMSKIVAEACALVMPKKPSNFVVDSVRVVKLMGSSLNRSEVIPGMVVTRPPEGNVHMAEDAAVAVFMESVDTASTETKGTVLLKSAEELQQYTNSEEKMMESMIHGIAAAGAKVIISGGKIGQIAMHYIEKFGLMAIRIQSKFELRRLARSLGARLCLDLKSITPDDLGHCKRAFTREVGLTKVVVFEQSSKETQIATILLRGSTQNSLNDYERALDDGINVVRAVCRDPRFVAGAGAAEIHLSSRISEFADRCSGMEQYAAKAFAEALEVFPRTLAENAGLQATDVLSKLYAAHERGQHSTGVDIESTDGSGVTTGTKPNVLDALSAKLYALKLGAETAITVLRVDQIIMAKPAGGPKAPQQQGHWDEQD